MMTRRPTYDELERRVQELERESVLNKSVKERLTWSESNFRNVIENAQEGILIIRNAKIIFANTRACEFLGCSEEELCNHPFIDFVHPDDREWLMDQYFKKLDREDVSLGQSYRVLGGGGHIRWVQSRSIRVEWSHSAALLSFLIDMTDMKVAEERLRESEGKYRHLIENMRDVIYSLDMEGRFTYVSPSVRILMGYVPDEVMGHSFMKFVYPDDLPFLMGRFKGVMAGETLSSDYRIVDKNQNVRWAHSSTSPTIENGKVVALQGILTDITKRKQAEEALLENEEKFRLISEQSLMAIVIIQDDGIKYANQAYSEMTGYPWEEIREWTVDDTARLIHPDDLPFVMEQGRKKAAGISDGVVTHYSYRGIRKDGRLKWVDQYSKTITYRGKPADLMTFIDIHEQKLAQDTLIQSEKRYRDLADSLPQIVFETDENGNLTFVNHNAFNMFGYSQHDLDSGINILEMLIPEDRNRAKKEIQILMRGEGSEVNEYTALRKDGSTFPVSIHSNRLMHENKFMGFGGIVIDLTQTKKAEEALRESEGKYRRIFENIQDVYFESSFEGIILEISPSIENMSQYKRDELIGRSLSDIYTHPDQRGEYLNLIVEKGKVNDLEISLTDKDGSKHPCSMTTSLLKDDHGNPIKLVGSMRNISERKQNEAEKKKLESQLRQAAKIETVGTLAGGIAHDFNNILGIILGNTELAMDDIPEWNPARQNLDEARTACLRAKELVRQILSFSRKSEVEQKLFNLATVVAESLKLLRASIPTSVDIRRNIPNHIDAILGDPTQIHQIMINLCSNAADAMENEGGILEVTLENKEIDEDTASRYPELNPGSHVHLRISDTGVGIHPEVTARIFDPYFTTKDVGKGTGLGLSVVHGIVTSHHGGISVESEIGKGTTFNILFPAIGGHIKNKPKTLRKFSTGTERIMFVDDEESMVKLNQQRLEKLGYKVMGKTDPSEALAFFRADPEQIDLVITDMTMPHMTGDRLAEEILNIRPDMPIILCTGYSQRMSDERARELGIRKYIEKPIEMENLARSIREVFDE